MKNIYNFLPPLLVALAIMPAPVQAHNNVPKIVVSITVDQLRSDYLNAFMPIYGEDGFKLLMKKGRVYSHAEYPQANLNRASAVATLSTGAVPYDHGVISEQWLDRKTLRPVGCVDDDAFPGVLTGECSSPKSLAVSTFGDELKVASEGKSIVYSIAPFRDVAILNAGHASDGAFWINRLTGRWCGSSYYGNFPAWVSFADRSNLLDGQLKTTSWKPISELTGNFCYFLSGGMKNSFEHKFKGDSRFDEFITSGLVNDYITDFALACVDGSGIGTDEVPDYLSIAYYAGSYKHKPVSEAPMEMQDTYMRLDKAIGKLLTRLQQKVGNDNIIVVLTSTGYCDEETADLSAYRIPTGVFHMNRTSGILNIYLSAIYGQGQYVESTFGNEIYLNHKLLENKQLSMVDVLDRCQELLLQCEGVKDVYTSQRLQLGAWTPGISRIRNSYNPKNSGDILLQATPGWRFYNEETKDNRIVRESYIPFPIVFWGGGIVEANIDTPVTTDCIAPTLAQIIRIRAPNACSSAALVGFRN